MEIIKLVEKPEYQQNKKLSRLFQQLNSLIQIVQKRQLPEQIIESINNDILMINNLNLSPQDLRYHMKSVKKSLIVKISRSLELLVPNYYRDRFGAIGMGIGIFLSGILVFITGEMAWLIIGLNFGFMAGLLVGMLMDKRAQESGKQLLYPSE